MEILKKPKKISTDTGVYGKKPVKEKPVKRIFLASVLACISVVFAPNLCGETFFVYGCEMINGELAQSPYLVKEGVLDGLFETGHIVFDDGVNNCEISMENTEQMNKLYKIAMDGGARYVIAIFSNAQKQVLPNKLDRVSCTVKYFIFDSKHMECIGQGEDGSDNTAKEAQIKGTEVLFSLGQSIAGKLESLFNSYTDRQNAKEGDRTKNEK
jgi:hypothetical protein